MNASDLQEILTALREAAIEGFMLRCIHRKRQKKFGDRQLLSKKALEIYKAKRTQGT